MKRNEDEEFDPPEPVDDTPMKKEAQIDLASQLQAMALRTFERRLKNGTISDTGLATLVRLLASNGWTLDPSQLPKELRDVLTSKIDAAQIDEDDDVLPFRKHA